MTMYDTEGITPPCIHDHLFSCQQPHQHIHLKENKLLQCTNSKMLLVKKVFHLLRIKSFSCFKHQINLNVVLLPFGSLSH